MRIIYRVGGIKNAVEKKRARSIGKVDECGQLSWNTSKTDIRPIFRCAEEALRGGDGGDGGVDGGGDDGRLTPFRRVQTPHPLQQHQRLRRPSAILSRRTEEGRFCCGLAAPQRRSHRRDESSAIISRQIAF